MQTCGDKAAYIFFSYPATYMHTKELNRITSAIKTKMPTDKKYSSYSITFV